MARTLMTYDFTDADYEAIKDREPDETIDTGLSSSEGATQLLIYRLSARTIVVPAGEFQNSEPWAHRKGHAGARMLADYLHYLDVMNNDD